MRRLFCLTKCVTAQTRYNISFVRNYWDQETIWSVSFSCFCVPFFSYPTHKHSPTNIHRIPPKSDPENCDPCNLQSLVKIYEIFDNWVLTFIVTLRLRVTLDSILAMFTDYCTFFNIIHTLLNCNDFIFLKIHYANRFRNMRHLLVSLGADLAVLVACVLNVLLNYFGLNDDLVSLRLIF